MKNKKQPLISIVVPVYNAQLFLEDTIKTVLNQTYKNWELLLIDDFSTDDSYKIIKQYLKTDKRIKYFKNITNSGAAISRNNGIKNSTGGFICFLDADDLWDESKLEIQLRFMMNNDYAFSFTSYEFANEFGEPNGKKVNVPLRINYRTALKNTVIWTSTVMLNMNWLSKEDIYMPNVKRGQDTATWWKILKKIDYAHGVDNVLSFYRRTNQSLSSNKIKALKRTWALYRNVEKLNFFYSLYNFFWYAVNALKRRI